MFKGLSVVECLIGVLFLIPKATRIVVPTLEGQYIIKNLVIVAVAIGIASQTPPLAKKH